MEEITDQKNERNIYIHPNVLARDIFWQRLECLYKHIRQHCNHTYAVMDFGGGSGAFSKGLCQFFQQVDLIDLDPDDAMSIKEYFNLNNLNIIKADICTYKTNSKQYDLIIAADVLEHFKNLMLPIEFIHSNLKSGGLLMVSLPTENFIYNIGRFLLRKQKPDDQYHTSREVMQCLACNQFQQLSKTFIPKYGIPIPLLEIAVFKKA